ncbi:hypothetical protein PCL1606_04550 [Pseudomonas chlororaphis]|uniref:Uncharacterized protein n=1 Tax=Pseudomonas chlororaphis TaxID=587753 RepID=A0A0D5XT96_9PSED|nr:hypothetical protein PCL1606_04550 [Pseudomonas chlororaphis]
MRRTVLGLGPGVERRHRGISSHKAGDGLRRRLLLLPSFSRETGFVITEQLPCLNLNGHSITPENDVAMRLYKPRAMCGL